MEFGGRLLIDSTPTFIFQNGKIIEDDASLTTLEDLLKLDSSL
jgi:protein-disulfide isomerase